MPDLVPTGPPVADHERLLRGITYPAWWCPLGNRPSSAAFRVASPFSVDIASRTTAPECLSRLLPKHPGSGIVSFECGAARKLGLDARDEKDELAPDNKANAHVSHNHLKSKLKTQGRELAMLCQCEIAPTFPLEPP